MPWGWGRGWGEYLNNNSNSADAFILRRQQLGKFTWPGRSCKFVGGIQNYTLLRAKRHNGLNHILFTFHAICSCT